jgi:hypothetical protein
LNHRQARINHRGQLPRKNDQVGQGYFAAAGAAFFAHLFLDGNDQEITI